MNKPYHILIVFLMLCFTPKGMAQIKVSYPEPEDTTTSVIVHADPRLAIITKKHVSVAQPGIHSGRGYRVQIYSGSDRNKAASTKIDFMRRYPGVRAYLSYVSPQFRVKVGDYRSRGEAQKMYQQVERRYTPCMIVPDIILVNTLNTQKDDQ
jgi:hypothetical protein